MGAVQELEQKTRAVAERAGPSVVNVGRRGRGSGVVVAEGKVLTNAHNLRDRTTSISFADGRAEQAEVVAVDPDGDLAVLAVDTADAPPVDWADPSGISAGTFVYTASRGRAGLRTTFGIVTSTAQAFPGPRGRRIRGSVEHTAPLARGSSGSPVLDGEGRVLALNTHRSGEGFYAALPADEAFRAKVEALAAGRAPTRRRLGLALAPTEVARRLRRSVGLPERDGLLVRAVDPDGRAAAAGIKEGDLLVQASGRALADADDLHDLLDELADDTPLTLVVVRGAEELTIEVTFDAGGSTADGDGEDATV